MRCNTGMPDGGRIASRMELSVSERFATTPDGWSLHLKRTVAPARFDPSLRPLIIVPGYGMNSFIFGYHPRGTSMERCLAEEGFEVWSVNLRGQGPSRGVTRRPAQPTLRRLADVDLGTVIDAVLTHPRTRADRAVMLGCSLGGSLSFAHVALRRHHRIAGIVAMGAPLRWVERPAILRLIFRSRRLAGLMRVGGTRRMAGLALPVAGRLPFLLRMYANTAHIDMKAAREMVKTVEDPHPRVNRDIAAWVKGGDMVLRGVNVTEAMRTVDLPLLVVAANRDGVVPVSTAMSAADVWGGGDVARLLVGTDDEWYAHACMFVGDRAKLHVFDPVAAWLRERA